MTTEITVTLPDPTDPTDWDDAVDADGHDTRVPAWSLEVVEDPAGVSAWVEGVAIDGDLHEGPAVDLIEADALALLAAVRAYRADSGRQTEDEETRNR